MSAEDAMKEKIKNEGNEMKVNRKNVEEEMSVVMNRKANE